MSAGSRRYGLALFQDVPNDAASQAFKATISHGLTSGGSAEIWRARFEATSDGAPASAADIGEFGWAVRAFE
jgi:hypothetical protein